MTDIRHHRRTWWACIGRHNTGEIFARYDGLVVDLREHEYSVLEGWWQLPEEERHRFPAVALDMFRQLLGLNSSARPAISAGRTANVLRAVDRQHSMGEFSHRASRDPSWPRHRLGLGQGPLPAPDASEAADLVAELRAAGIRYETIAELLDNRVSTRTLRRWEKGESLPGNTHDLDALNALARSARHF